MAVAGHGRCGHGVVRRRPVPHLPAAPRRRDGRSGDRRRRRHDAGRVGDVLRAQSERPGRRHRRPRWRWPDQRAGVCGAAASRRPAHPVLRRRLDGLLRHRGGGAQSEHDRDGARRARPAERGRGRRLASAHAGAAPAAIGVHQHRARRVGRGGHHRRIRCAGGRGSIDDLGHERDRRLARQRRAGAGDDLVLRRRRDRPVPPLLPVPEPGDDPRHGHRAVSHRRRAAADDDAHAPAAEPDDGLRQRRGPGADRGVGGRDCHLGRADLCRTGDVRKCRRHARRRVGLGGVAAVVDAMVLRRRGDRALLPCLPLAAESGDDGGDGDGDLSPERRLDRDESVRRPRRRPPDGVFQRRGGGGSGAGGAGDRPGLVHGVLDAADPRRARDVVAGLAVVRRPRRARQHDVRGVVGGARRPGRRRDPRADLRPHRQHDDDAGPGAADPHPRYGRLVHAGAADWPGRTPDRQCRPAVRADGGALQRHRRQPRHAGRPARGRLRAVSLGERRPVLRRRGRPRDPDACGGPR